MTTIAWDGSTLAADRCSWSGGTRRAVRKVFKIRRVDGSLVLVAFCGSGEFAHAVLAWLQAGGDKPNCADFGVDPELACALVIDDRHRVWSLGGRLIYQRMRDRMFATGAGQEFAWGALEAGADAKRAVQIAAKRSDFAALGVDTVKF